MTARNYSSTAQLAALTTAVNSTATTMSVSTVTGWPLTCPFTVVVDDGTASEEITTVSVVSGTTLTVVRAQDGPAGVPHSVGASVRHMLTARDLREPQEHIAASTTVHGLDAASSVVGTAKVQTLTSKTISGASNTFSGIPEAAVTGLVADLAAVGPSATQTLTNKTVSGAANTLSSIPQTAVTGLTAALAATGQVLVTPASVAGSGVALSGSRVVLTAASSVSVNGCFTAAYDNYRIEIDVPVTSAVLNIPMVLRAAGVDETAANYDSQSMQAWTSVTEIMALAQTSWQTVAASAPIHRVTVELTRPAQASPTVGQVRAFSTTNPMTSAASLRYYGILHRLAAAYDGFTLSASTGTMTGTLRVFGYNV